MGFDHYRHLSVPLTIPYGAILVREFVLPLPSYIDETRRSVVIGRVSKKRATRIFRARGSRSRRAKGLGNALSTRAKVRSEKRKDPEYNAEPLKVKRVSGRGQRSFEKRSRVESDGMECARSWVGEVKSDE